MSGRGRSAQRGAGVLKYLLAIAAVVFVVGYVFADAERLGAGDGPVAQAVCALMEPSSCASRDAGYFEPERLEWEDPREETCFLALCW